MAETTPDALGQMVLGKLYSILANGDKDVPRSDNFFFTWCSPGMPVDPGDFEFLSTGLTGVPSKEKIEELRNAQAPDKPADGSAPAGALSPSQLEQLGAQDAVRRYQQAESLARLVNFIPDVTKGQNDQFAKFNIANNQGSLSSAWESILRNSQVMQSTLTEDDKKKIDRLRGLLQVKKKKTNIVDGTETEVTEPSPMVIAYNEKMAAYEAAVLEYHNKRIEAMTAANQRAVHDWAMNAKIYRNKVTAADSDWITNGYKLEYQQISAYFDQVMSRDLTLLKAHFKDDLDKAKLTGVASGSDFYYTSLIPSSFAKATGWTHFRFDKSHVAGAQTTKFNTTKWDAKAKLGFLGVGGGSGSHSQSKQRQEFTGTLNTDTFALDFAIAQVQIARPWFEAAPWFFNSTAWRFDQNNPDIGSEILSDGGAPPKGMIPAYPTAVIFVRDLKMEIGNSQALSSFVSEQKSKASGGEASVSFGPFSLGGGGSYSSKSGNTDKKWDTKNDSQKIEVPGLQIIGFKCHVPPKSPRPNPKIKEWV